MGSATEEKRWVICPVCHKENPAGVSFCEHCWGAAIDPDAPSVTDEELRLFKIQRDAYVKRRKTIKLSVIAAGALALLFLIFLGINDFTDLISKPVATLNSNSAPGDWAMFHHDISHTGTSSSSNVIPQGTLLWSYQTGAPVHASPAVSNGTVYMGSENSIFYAFDAKSGSIKWQYQTGSWVDSSPAVADGSVYFGSNDGFFYSLKTQDGALNWQFKTTFPVRSTPAVAGNMVYFGSDDYYLYALNAASGRKVWDYGLNSPAISPPTVANGIVYIGAADGYTYSLNALNGQRRLRFETHYAVYSGPVVSGTTVYVVTTNGRLNAFNGTVRTKLQEHEIKPFWTQLWMMGIPGIPKPPEQSGYLWAADLRGAINTSPVVSGNNLYVGLENKLIAFDITTKKKTWSFTTKGTVRSSPAIVNNVLYFGSDDSNMYAVDATNGNELWHFTTGSAITSSPAVVDGVVYFGSNDGTVYAVK